MRGRTVRFTPARQCSTSGALMHVNTQSLSLLNDAALGGTLARERDYRTGKAVTIMSIPRSKSALPALLCMTALALPAQGADAQRGQLLYENHCTGCHDSRAHVRDNRRARSLADVRGWVVRWSQHLTLEWGENERGDVAAYLYDRYYSDAQ